MPDHPLTPQQWSNQQQRLQAEINNPNRPAALQVGTHIALGNLYYDVARYPVAHDHYAHALQISPHSLDARFGYANALRHLGRYDEAIAAYDIAIAHNPQRVELWINRGRAHHHSGSPDAAIADFEADLNLDPQDYRLWQRRGDLLYSLERYGGAVISYAQALFTQPLKTEAILQSCLFLASPGPYVQRYETAFHALDQQLASHPHHAPSWKLQGQRLAHFGFWLEAWSSYGRALTCAQHAETTPRDTEILLLQAHTLEQLERRDDALATYQSALEDYLTQGDLVGETRCREALAQFRARQTKARTALPPSPLTKKPFWKNLRWGRLFINPHRSIP